LKVTRNRYQRGSLRKVVRRNGSPVWEYRYRDHNREGSPLQQLTFSTVEFPTETHVWRKLEGFVMKLNDETSHSLFTEPTFGLLIDRFIEDERLKEIKAQRPGQMPNLGLKFSTACSYLSVLNQHLRPKWGSTLLRQVRAVSVQHWIRNIEAAPKTKAHIKALMHRLFEKAMLWEWIEVQRNPMELVEVKGISKRRRKPFILTPEQYYALLEALPESYRTMVVVAQCLGLRVSEILVLKWSDFDFANLSLRVTRAVVHGRVDYVKTEYSEDDLPLDPDFGTVMLNWKARCPETPGGWVFPNPATLHPFHASPIQQDYIRSAGWKIGLKQSIGWHTFRHTYRSLLDATGAPIGVQQKLIRHAQVATTMDTYGNAQMQAKREANGKVVRLVLRTA
jgi:integrase